MQKILPATKQSNKKMLTSLNDTLSRLHHILEFSPRYKTFWSYSVDLQHNLMLNGEAK